MVLPGTYTAKLTVDGRRYSQTITVVPDPRVAVSSAALAAQFQLQQRMVAGITATYHALNYVQELHDALAARTKEATSTAAAEQIAKSVQTLEAALAPLANGAAGFGIAHRDLGRRLNDMLVGDQQPTASVIAGVDGPCRAIDVTLESLRRLQTTNVAELNSMLARARLAALPIWTPQATPACGPQ
jgi:hypothetical protein